MPTHCWLLVGFMLLPVSVRTADLCSKVTCYGQAFCHEVVIPCGNKTVGCTIKLPACFDKTVDDYAQDLVTSKTVEEILKNPDYMKSNDKEVLCRGFNCYGMNSCTITRVPCVDDPNCVNYLPACDDSPIQQTLALTS